MWVIANFLWRWHKAFLKHVLAVNWAFCKQDCVHKASHPVRVSFPVFVLSNIFRKSSYWRTSSVCRGIKTHVNTKFKKYFRETFQYDFPSHEIPHAQVNHLQFMLGRALAPVVLHPRQNGGVNLERIYTLSIAFRSLLSCSSFKSKGMFLPFFPCELQNLLQISWSAINSVSSAFTFTRSKRVVYAYSMQPQHLKIRRATL